jgi:ketosteroid isomerase-like protein
VSAKQDVARRTIPLCGIVLILGSLYSGLNAQTAQASKQDAVSQELTALVQKFLADVPANQRPTFDQFFADDIIYTRGTGQVVTKKDILADTGNPSAPRANATYAGEDFQVHPYGNMAIVNFRLVMHATEDGKPVTRSFRNTGTFLKRNGRWQAIAWQATPIAEK